MYAFSWKALLLNWLIKQFMLSSKIYLSYFLAIYNQQLNRAKWAFNTSFSQTTKCLVIKLLTVSLTGVQILCPTFPPLSLIKLSLYHKPCNINNNDPYSWCSFFRLNSCFCTSCKKEKTICLILDVAAYVVHITTVQWNPLNIKLVGMFKSRDIIIIITCSWLVQLEFKHGLWLKITTPLGEVLPWATIL